MDNEQMRLRWNNHCGRFLKPIFMDTINEIPLRWDAEGDNVLLGGLLGDQVEGTPPFPQQNNTRAGNSINTFDGFIIESPFTESRFGNFNFREVKNNITDDGVTTYIDYRDFDTEEQMDRFFIGVSTDNDNNRIEQLLSQCVFTIVCSYVRHRTDLENGIAFMFNGKVGAKLAALSVLDLKEKLAFYAKRIIEMREANYVSTGVSNGFTYEEPAIVNALQEAVPFTYEKMQSQNRLPKETKKIYEANYEFFRHRVENIADPATEQAVRRLCALLVKLDHDVVETYGQATDLRYNTDRLAKKGEKLSIRSILSMIRRLQKTATSVKYFQNNIFNNQDEVIAFVNKNYVDNSAIGAEAHFVINFPFKKLGYEQRKRMIRLFLRNSPLEFSGFWAGAHLDGHRDISAGDIVYNLLITATDKDRLRLVHDLDNADNDLFYLLEGSSGDCFMTISFIVGCAILGTLDSEEKMGKVMEASIKEQKFFFFDDYDDSKVQNHSYDVETKSIKLENKGHRYTNPIRIYRSTGSDMDKQRQRQIEAEKQFYENEKLYMDKRASPKILFHPLDFIVITAESDLKSDVLKMLFANVKDDSGEAYSGLKKDGMVILPACIVYLLFKEYHDKNRAYAILAVTMLLFLPFGIGALVSAIQAANAIGIIVAIADVTLDVTVLAVNDPKAIENNKERADFVNTLAFFYALARLPSVILGVDSLVRSVNKNLRKALGIHKAKEVRLIQQYGAFKPISSNGLRGEIPLTKSQKRQIIEYAKKYGIPEDNILFKVDDSANTSYSPLFGLDILYVNTDVMPGINTILANSKVSWKGAIAHELEGHRAAAFANKTNPDPLLEEVQASLRASLHGKDLTKIERKILVQDAIERLNKNGLKLKDVKSKLWLSKY